MTGKIPKTSQLYYFLMPEETTKVLAFIKDQKCSLYSTRSRFLGPEPIKCDPASIPSMVFICPEGFNNEIDMIKISEGVYVVDPTTSPVIEMQCSIMRKKELSRGRVYFRCGYLGRDEWVPFPVELYELYKNVAAFMKKSFFSKEKKYGGYISKGCQSYVSGGGTLTQI
jgi:hypothetical protein